MLDMEKMKENFAAELEKVFAEDFDEIFAEEIADALDGKIVLHDEDGNDVEFEFLDQIEYEGKEYVVLFPIDDIENGGEIVILEVAESENEDEETLLSVEDEKTLMTVYNIFREKYRDDFNFVD